MKYFIGLDGGGSKTKCVLTDDNFNIISEATGDASNFLIRGTDVVSEILFNLINNVTNSAGKSVNEVEAIVLGTTGAGRRNNAETMEKAFRDFMFRKGIEHVNFIVDSDARIALEGAFSGKPGSILIAGTGSIMFGKAYDGTIHRVGGFGRYIGDEGSGYSIGKLGFQAVAKQMDGRGAATILSKMIADKFRIIDAPQLITEIYTNNFDIASLTPLVIDAAERGDKICRDIINQQSDELVEHIEAMLKMLNEEVMKVSLIGSTITTDNHYAEIFKNKVAAKFSNVVIVEPELPPALGAVVMAKELSEH